MKMLCTNIRMNNEIVIKINTHTLWWDHGHLVFFPFSSCYPILSLQMIKRKLRGVPGCMFQEVLNIIFFQNMIHGEELYFINHCQCLRTFYHLGFNASAIINSLKYKREISVGFVMGFMLVTS